MESPPGRGLSILTFLHLLSGLLVGHPRVRTHAQAEGLPQQDAVAPHVALGAVTTCEEQQQSRRPQPQSNGQGELPQ